MNSVENNRPGRPPLGPGRSGTSRPLSSSRTAILNLLRDQPQPVTQAALVAATGLHANTVREHLEGLARRGLVRRTRAVPEGRGRPPWLYELVAEPRDSEYTGLAVALAAAIAQRSASPSADASAAGKAWGRTLAKDRPAQTNTAQEARQEVVHLLEELGFQPRVAPSDPALVRLTRCPLLEAAHRHRDVVCGVHLGLVQGALEEYGADSSGSELVPFSEPGACRLLLPPMSGNPR